MPPILKTREAEVYALMRIVVGFCFMWHGSQKLLGVPGGAPGGAPAFVIYIAGPIELVGGLLIMIGFLTQWAAFVASGLMAFAYWLAHGTKALLPIQNQGEMAVLYCFVFLYISARGGGLWSFDGA